MAYNTADNVVIIHKDQLRKIIFDEIQAEYWCSAGDYEAVPDHEIDSCVDDIMSMISLIQK